MTARVSALLKNGTRALVLAVVLFSFAAPALAQVAPNNATAGQPGSGQPGFDLGRAADCGLMGLTGGLTSSGCLGFTPSTSGQAAQAGLGLVTSPIAVIMWVVFKIASLLLYIAGILFNWTVAALVFNFRDYLGNSPGMLIAWRILRDFGNIALIFGFVLAGFQTILDVGHFNVGKALSRLVIAAVLLNFSLFAAEAVIDVTNVLAAQFYQQVNQGPVACDPQHAIDCLINTGVAGTLMEKLQITTAFSTDDLGTNIVNQVQNPIGNILKFTALAILISVAAMVLFAGALFLLSRGIILAFLMITSPIGFAGVAVPQLEKLAGQWWEKLLQQSMFAPVFLLLLFASLKVTDGLTTLAGPSGSNGLADVFTATNVSTTGVLFLFFLIIAFMVGSLMLANRFGILGADMAIKAAGGAVYGTMGWAGRRAFGEPARLAAERLNRSRFGTETMLGRNLARFATATSKNSMDLRTATPLGGLLKGAKVDVGKTSDIGKKGRVGEIDAFKKRANEEAKAKADARKAQDTGYTTQMDELKRSEDIARANADIATRRAASNTGPARDQHLEDARQQTEVAEGLRRQRENVQAEFAQVQKGRLSMDDRRLQGYYDRTRDDAGREAAAAGAAAGDAERAMERAAERMETAAERIAALNEEAASGRVGTPDGRNRAEFDADMRAAETLRDVAREERETAERNRETSLEQRAIARRNREEFGNRAQAHAERVADPKYAMEQMARSYSQLAGTLRGRMIDPAKLRAAATSIRKDRGRTHTEHVLDEFKELMEHHGAHSAPAAPAEDAHPPAAGGGGGGGPAPH